MERKVQSVCGQMGSIEAAMNTEDQYEWILENPDGKMTKELSAQELKVLYDAAYTDDKNVVVDCLDACGIWYRYDTKHAPWADYIHRVSRKITATPLDIPWDLIDNVYNYAAMDKNCNVYFYKSEPFVKEGREDWWPDGGDFTKSLLKHNINGINWEHSLAKRCQTK